MAHSGATMDLGGIRPTANETAKRPGFSRTPVILTVGVALGLALGAGAWAIGTTRTASTTNDAAAFGAVHEKIEAHQAAVAAGADRTNDQIELHRMAAANTAAGAVTNSGYDQIEAHRTVVANQAAGSVTTPIGRAYSRGIVLAPTPRVFDPGGETPDTRGGVPAGIAPDYYRPYVDRSQLVVPVKPVGRAYSQGIVIGSVAATAASTSRNPGGNPLP